jgi:AraC-like DNA-binding protein
VRYTAINKTNQVVRKTNMSPTSLKPLTWGHVNIGHTPQLTLLCCEHLLLQPSRWGSQDFSSPYWRLYWNDRTGACLRDAGGKRHALGTTHFVLVAPNTTLSQELTHPVTHYYTHFTIGLPFAHVQSNVYQIPAPPSLVEAMRGVYPQRGTDADPDRQARCVATALNLCWHVLASLPDEAMPVADRYPPRLLDLLTWWEGQNWRPASNRVLAERMRMHPNAFCRYFRQAMGVAPQTYGQIRRIDHACLLLHFSKLSIKQVAEATGFCDRYYFSYTFQKLRGISPAAFRRQCITADIA